MRLTGVHVYEHGYLVDACQKASKSNGTDLKEIAGWSERKIVQNKLMSLATH